MPKAPKLVYATVDEVLSLRTEVLNLINETQEQSNSNVRASEGRLQTAVDALREHVKLLVEKATMERDLKEMKRVNELSVNAALERLQVTKTELETQITEAKDLTQSGISRLDSDLRQEVGKTVKDLTEVIDEELQALKKKVGDDIVACSNTALAGLTKLQEATDSLGIELRESAVRGAWRVSEQADQALKEAVAKQAASDEERDRLAQATREAIVARLDQHDMSFRKTYVDVDAKVQEGIRRIEDFKKELCGMNDDHKDRIDRGFAMLKDAVDDVDNINTRRVDWVINGISRHLKQREAAPDDLRHISLFSPKFNMAGCNGLTLEFQYLVPTSPPSPGEEVGDVAVFLWAPKGLTLHYRLYVGNKYQTLEKTFNGRLPYGTQRLCFVHDQIDRSEDSLKVSVEILETHRQVEHVIESTVELERPVGLCLDDVPASECSVRFHRHVDHRIFDRVKHEIELMRSRLVRKVEWRLEQASQMRQCFKQGEPVCSPQFMAAGLERLQLMFYPSGYSGANEGYCSLFVHGPAGAFLKCSLHLGSQTRDASHTFDEDGAFGRTNFCRYEAVVDDGTDTVLVAIHILEAHQDVVTDQTHLTASSCDIAKNFKSTMKLRSSPGKESGMEVFQTLPSIWSRAFEKSITQPPDGMHSFDEMKVKAKSQRLGTSQSQGTLVRFSPSTTGTSMRDLESPLSPVKSMRRLDSQLTFGSLSSTGFNRRRPQLGEKSTGVLLRQALT